MDELARWSLKVSRDTDVRLRQTAGDVRARNAHLDEAEVLRLVDEELAAVRAEASPPRGLEACALSWAPTS